MDLALATVAEVLGSDGRPRWASRVESWPSTAKSRCRPAGLSVAGGVQIRGSGRCPLADSGDFSATSAGWRRHRPDRGWALRRI